jgi:DNA polymerase-2
MEGKRRGKVAYVITTLGPEPADDRRHPIDHEHYVERQLRPVAEPVLALLGQDFVDASGARRQLSLF